MITAVFILTLLNTLILVVLGLFMLFTSTGYAKRSSLEAQTQPSEDLKKFYEEDRKAAQEFLSSISEFKQFHDRN